MFTESPTMMPKPVGVVEDVDEVKVLDADVVVEVELVISDEAPRNFTASITPLVELEPRKKLCEDLVTAVMDLVNDLVDDISFFFMLGSIRFERFLKGFLLNKGDTNSVVGVELWFPGETSSYSTSSGLANSK